MHGVRRARIEDRAAVTASAAAAFADDPAWSFLLGEDYDRLAPLFAGVLFDLRVGAGTVWVTGDGASMAIWEAPAGEAGPPGPWERSEEAWGQYRAVAGEAVWRRLVEYERAVDAARPTTPYWYLGVLATRPDRQGHGLATAVTAPVLATADSDGIDCCLETSTAKNRAFYERRGFSDVTDVHITGGPPTWWLRRRSP